MERVSIIIPCYNDGENLPQAVASGLRQTYEDVEIVVVDDGSTDPYTLQVISALHQDRVTVIHTQNGGPSRARNLGISLCSGAYILPLDSDDTIEPSYVEKAIAVLESRPDVGIVYCRARNFGLETGEWLLGGPGISDLLCENYIFVTAMFRKSDWVTVEGFKEKYIHGLEDYDFWLSIVETGKKVFQIPEILFNCRVRSSSRTASLIASERMFSAYEMIIDSHEGLYRDHFLEVIKELKRRLLHTYWSRREQVAAEDMKWLRFIRLGGKEKVRFVLKYVLGKLGLLEFLRAARSFLTKQALKVWKARELDDADRAILASKPFEAEYRERKSYGSRDAEVKAICYYLPQFHQIPENDEWWGRGFTEWVNVKRAKPLFEGHYQPRKPHGDIGYYDLSRVASIKKQAQLLKDYGIYGLAIYYYWFSGKKILDKPLDIIAEDRSIDLRFCLFWANENWTNIWVGREEEVLIRNSYQDSDPIQFIVDADKYLTDPRYIRVDNKPVLIIYKVHDVPDLRNVVRIWREYWQSTHREELYLLGVTHDPIDGSRYQYEPRDFGLDGCVEFGPNYLYNYLNGRFDSRPNKNLELMDYRKIIDEAERVYRQEFRSVVLPTVYNGFDNSPRRRNGSAQIMAPYSLKSFHHWLTQAIAFVKARYAPAERLVFIHSWNEWAEGSAIEPDERYGYSYLDIVGRAICSLPWKPSS